MTLPSRTERKKGSASHIPPAEWAVAIIGLLLVMGAVVVLAIDSLNQRATPPSIELTIDSIVRTPHAYGVKLVARNHGGEAAADAIIEGALLDAAGSVTENSQARVDYLAPGAERRLGLFFHAPPTRAQLRLRVAGYQVP